MRDGLAGRSRRGIAGLGSRIMRHLEGSTHSAAGKAQRAQQDERDHNAELETAVHLSLLNPIHSVQRQPTSETA